VDFRTTNRWRGSTRHRPAIRGRPCVAVTQICPRQKNIFSGRSSTRGAAIVVGIAALAPDQGTCSPPQSPYRSVRPGSLQPSAGPARCAAAILRRAETLPTAIPVVYIMLAGTESPLFTHIRRSSPNFSSGWAPHRGGPERGGGVGRQVASAAPFALSVRQHPSISSQGTGRGPSPYGSRERESGIRCQSSLAAARGCRLRRIHDALFAVTPWTCSSEPRRAQDVASRPAGPGPATRNAEYKENNAT